MTPKMVTGYAHGKPFPLAVVEAEPGIWLESGTAAAWLDMKAAAALDGVSLKANQGWRSMLEQEHLFDERSAPEAAKKLGVAAKPGWSAHQSGRAVDIHTGLTIGMFREGMRSPVFNWLEQRAAEFGFKRTVAAEPWHHEHQIQETR